MAQFCVASGLIGKTAEIATGSDDEPPFSLRDRDRCQLASVVDAVDGSSTGIAMCQIAPVIQLPPMSLIGTLQTSLPTLSMSALGGKADMGLCRQGVRPPEAKGEVRASDRSAGATNTEAHPKAA
jgi:hypothetical protein